MALAINDFFCFSVSAFSAAHSFGAAIRGYDDKEEEDLGENKATDYDENMFFPK